MYNVRSFSYETVYARAVHPCYSDVSAVQILPSKGRADSVITLPISLTEALTPRFSALGPDGKEDRLSTEQPPVMHHDGPGLVHQKNSDSASYGDGVWLMPGDELHPFSHAHLLLPQRPHESIPFPIVCVASHNEIYELLSSALFQRRVFGVEDPVLGFTFDPLGYQIQVVIAWLSQCVVDGHSCVSNIPILHCSLS